MSRLALIILSLYGCIAASAQSAYDGPAGQSASIRSRQAGLRYRAADSRPFGVAYYDVDALYDTVPSRFYDDRAYTPQGRMRWDGRRYRRKIANTARVIDSMGMDIVALYGVENEQVVRDIAEACGNDYSYIHRTTDGDRGLDFALLYLGDRFFPERVTPWRGALCVEGEATGKPLAVIIDHRCTSLGVLIEGRNLLKKDFNIIILGFSNNSNFNEYNLDDRTSAAEKAGRGNIFGNGRWIMRDRIATNIEGRSRCDVYVRSWMLTPDGQPRPTFDRTKYYGGYGRYLPIFIYFDETFGY